jgi:hypothetical protein
MACAALVGASDHERPDNPIAAAHGSCSFQKGRGGRDRSIST